MTALTASPWTRPREVRFVGEPVCGTCGKPEDFPADSKSELRPYGPGGEMICFRCAFATPEAEVRTEANFTAIVEATHATVGIRPSRTSTARR